MGAPNRGVPNVPLEVRVMGAATVTQPLQRQRNQPQHRIRAKVGAPRICNHGQPNVATQVLAMGALIAAPRTCQWQARQRVRRHRLWQVQRQRDRPQHLSSSLEQCGRVQLASTTASAMLEVAGIATKTGPYAAAHSLAVHVRFVNWKGNGANGQSAALLAELVVNQGREVLALAMSLPQSPGSAT